MQIKVNQNKEIIGFATLGGFPDGIEVDALPEGFEDAFYPGKYIYTDGFIKKNSDFVQPKNNRALLEEIASLKDQLAQTDYKAIKYVEGWISEEEYAPIKAERQEVRNRINALEAEL